MKDPEKQNSLVVKFSGKAEISKELEIGRNYDITAQGTVTALTEADKNDGSHIIYYKFEPIVVELITDKGEKIRTSDTRSRSQQFRSIVYKIWRTDNNPTPFEEYYDKLMVNLIAHAGDLTGMYEST